MAKGKAGAVGKKPKLRAGPFFIDVKTDWKGYFREFDKLHGGNTGPVMQGKRLLYPDGWMYSARDYRGPEWPPPMDEELLRVQKKTYWSLFHKAVSREIEELENSLRELRDAQLQRSAPLQCRLTYTEEDENGKTKVRQKSDTLSPEIFQGRLIWLQGHLEDCEHTLKTLTKEDEPLVFDIKGNNNGEE